MNKEVIPYDSKYDVAILKNKRYKYHIIAQDDCLLAGTVIDDTNTFEIVERFKLDTNTSQEENMVRFIRRLVVTMGPSCPETQFIPLTELHIKMKVERQVFIGTLTTKTATLEIIMHQGFVVAGIDQGGMMVAVKQTKIEPNEQPTTAVEKLVSDLYDRYGHDDNCGFNFNPNLEQELDNFGH